MTYTEEETLRELQDEVDQLSHTRFAYLRADWFVATASRPPLYDQLLNLPDSLADLEHRLGVSLVDNFLNDKLKRAGMVQSNVSRNNRIVERHVTRFNGAYWRSYDTNSNSARSNFLRYPLGPLFDGNPYEDQAFEYAGGEVIFNLPNGLQAYGLYDGKDRRLDGPAPISIVRDLRESSGTPEVVNGLSCINCHSQGMKEFKDAIRLHPAVFGDARRKVERLYPPQAEMDKLVAADRQRFLSAAEEATGRFLKFGPDAKKDIADFEEPVSALVRFYLQDLTPDTVTAELGLPDVAALDAAIRGNRRLSELGLGPLLDANGVKRQLWESPGLSLFHEVSLEFGKTIRKDL